jgi:hypothetical protein
METALNDPAVVATDFGETHPARSRRGFWALIATQFQGAYMAGGLLQ